LPSVIECQSPSIKIQEGLLGQQQPKAPTDEIQDRSRKTPMSPGRVLDDAKSSNALWSTREKGYSKGD